MSKTYTRADISKAVNGGADLVHDELGLGERDYDLLGLIVNAAMAVLDQPGTSLDDVIRDSYKEEPEEVRGWWDW
ncbi:hypothetical protein [Streptomyces uncialis]|uniref:Uncharacterized protein n=1 Tax=Streptomyces uncialis TaxID=1048205 RepID=A0A1Q4VC66_9ACTN|nr:hypothetical protein [Streptomyces uncialis]OKH95406.1 hypothetical protein AB852_00590 [Streptomyces uncialis]